VLTDFLFCTWVACSAIASRPNHLILLHSRVGNRHNWCTYVDCQYPTVGIWPNYRVWVWVLGKTWVSWEVSLARALSRRRWLGRCLAVSRRVPRTSSHLVVESTSRRHPTVSHTHRERPSWHAVLQKKKKISHRQLGPLRGSSSPFQHFEPARVKPN